MSDKPTVLASHPGIEKSSSRAAPQLGATVRSADYVRDLGIDAARGRRWRTTTAQARRLTA
eukprot:8403513-Pyramimonas_sp.AAC.1